MSDKIRGFSPIFDANSELLILGSFPSVKSRAQQFYYGNRQNRFWKMLFGYFGEAEKDEVEAKKEFLLRRRIALWDIVEECSIVGSSDATITDYTLADIPSLLRTAPIREILLNGATAYNLFFSRYAGIGVPYRRMPSTSPANPRYDQGVWFQALEEVFGWRKGDILL